MDQPVNQSDIQRPAQEPSAQPQVQAFTPVAKPPAQSPHRFPFVWILVLCILFGAAFGAGIFLRTKKEESVQQAAPTPTLLPTETPVHRQIDPIATSSAYLKLEGYVASLSASLSAYQVENQSVAPPVLDLPLGFTQE